MVDRHAVRTGYDALADAHADERTADDRSMALLREFLEELPESPAVLDAGCGQGTPVLDALSEATTAYGLDVSRTQLDLAAANAPAAALVQGDLTALPVTSDAVDAVVAYWSLIHVPMEDHQPVIEEFKRVLRPGGRVLLCEGTNEWVGENPDWLDSGVGMEWAIAGAERTREQLRTAGFAVVDEWGCGSTLATDQRQRARRSRRGRSSRRSSRRPTAADRPAVHLSSPPSTTRQ